MKALPKLSKAQQEAWARILEWRSTYRLARSFRAGGTAGWRDNLENSVATSDATLKALTRKGLLISAGEKFGFNRYMVNPDYLPDSEPAAEPESEPVAVEYFAPVDPIAASEPATGQFTKGQRVYLPSNSLFKDTTSPRYGTVTDVKNLINSNGDNFQQVWVQFDDPNFGKREVHPSFLIIASEPATDDDEAAQKLRVWFAANVTLDVPVNTLAQAVTVLETLTNSIPYPGNNAEVISAGGLQVFKDGKWKEWYSEDGEDIEDYIEHRLMEVYPEFLITAASEPATDDRPTSDEARLIDSITEARMERQRLENENASLTSQLEALRVRYAEMEAENASLQRQNGDVLSVVKELEAENLTYSKDREYYEYEANQAAEENRRLEEGRDFWRAKYDRLKTLEAENTKLREAALEVLSNFNRLNIYQTKDNYDYSSVELSINGKTHVWICGEESFGGAISDLYRVAHPEKPYNREWNES